MTAEDTISASTIRAFGADSIGDVLARMSARYGGDGFAILVNGRRIGGIEAIAALPPEALAKIDVLPASAAGRFGLPTDERILNLELRPSFRTATIEGIDSVPTDGGGGTHTGATRYAHIRDDNSFNVALTYRRSDGLRQSDRGIAASPADDPSTAVSPLDLTLVPRGDTVTVTIGRAGRMGSANFDLSLDGGTSSTHSTSGFGERRSLVRYLHSGISANGLLRGASWTLAASMGSTSSDTHDPAGDNDARSGGVKRLTSRSRDLTVSGDIGGDVFALPDGALHLTTSFSALATASATRAESAERFLANPVYHSFTVRENAELPITGSGRRVGGIAANLGTDYTNVPDMGEALAYHYGLEWTAHRFVTLSIRRSAQPSLPSAQQLYSPIVSRTGVAFLDDASDRTIPVTILAGGTTDQRGASAHDDIYRANAAYGRLSLSGSYAVSRMDHPLFSFGAPSALLEKLRPELFTRGADGMLLTYDSRAFAGISEIARRLSWNLHLSGFFGGARTGSMSITEGGGLSWDVGINHDIALNDTVRLDARSGPIDVLDTPLDLGSSSPSRHRVSAQISMNGRRFGTSLAVAWKSGSNGGSRSVSGKVSRVDPLTQIGSEAFIDFVGKDVALDDPARLRLKISVDNLLGHRPHLAVGDPAGTYGLTSDPLGRTVTFALRKVL